MRRCEPDPGRPEGDCRWCKNTEVRWNGDAVLCPRCDWAGGAGINEAGPLLRWGKRTEPGA